MKHWLVLVTNSFFDAKYTEIEISHESVRLIRIDILMVTINHTYTDTNVRLIGTLKIDNFLISF